MSKNNGKEKKDNGKVDKKEANLKLCTEHRKKIGMPALTEKNHLMDVPCDPIRVCHKGCPLPEDEKIVKNEKKEDIHYSYPLKCPDSQGSFCTRDKCPEDKNCKHKRATKAEAKPKKEKNIETIVKEVLAKPKKAISPEVEDFCYIQARVFDKILYHPEIILALDKLHSTEILARLTEQKQRIEDTVPPQFGGDMKLQASKDTKKYFESLEKKFAEEDKKAGKPDPKPIEGLEGRQMGGQAITKMLEDVEGTVWNSDENGLPHKCSQCGKPYWYKSYGDDLCDECFNYKAKKGKGK